MAEKEIPREIRKYLKGKKAHIKYQNIWDIVLGTG